MNKRTDSFVTAVITILMAGAAIASFYTPQIYTLLN